MSAFSCGLCLAIAMWSGDVWIREGKRRDAVMFWSSLAIAAVNGLLWAVAA